MNYEMIDASEAPTRRKGPPQKLVEFKRLVLTELKPGGQVMHIVAPSKRHAKSMQAAAHSCVKKSRNPHPPGRVQTSMRAVNEPDGEWDLWIWLIEN